MIKQNDVCEFIRLALKRRRLTSKKFCEEYGFEPTYFSRFLCGKTRISLKYLLQVCVCLRIKFILDDPKVPKFDL